jgi:hypothetical protein
MDGDAVGRGFMKCFRGGKESIAECLGETEFREHVRFLQNQTREECE